MKTNFEEQYKMSGDVEVGAFRCIGAVIVTAELGTVYVEDGKPVFGRTHDEIADKITDLTRESGVDFTSAAVYFRIYTGLELEEAAYRARQLSAALAEPQTETKGDSMFNPLKDGLCVTCGRDARNHDFGGACRPGSAMEDLAALNRGGVK